MRRFIKIQKQMHLKTTYSKRDNSLITSPNGASSHNQNESREAVEAVLHVSSKSLLDSPEKEVVYFSFSIEYLCEKVLTSYQVEYKITTLTTQLDLYLHRNPHQQGNFRLQAFQDYGSISFIF